MLPQYQMFRGKERRHTEYYLWWQFFTTPPCAESWLKPAEDGSYVTTCSSGAFFFLCKQLVSSACVSSLAGVQVACPVQQDFNYQV